MLSHQLGFVSSWKMLTRDKGWLKPLLVIALVSWIPLLGQIVVLGYGLEWARLTAWGVDAAPKQRGVDYKKMLATGGIAFLIALLVNIVLGGVVLLVLRIVYQATSSSVGFVDFVLGGLVSTVIGVFFDGEIPLLPFVLLYVVNIFVEALILAAQLRATLYDSFGAGWRLDRIFQMVRRDFTCFLHAALIAAVASTVGAVLDKLVSAAATAVVLTGVAMRRSLSMMGPGMMMYSQTGSNVVPFLIVLVVGVVAFYLFQVVKVALSLVAINTMGQWFQRFDVGRWGVSSAPLPDGVPYSETAYAETAPTAAPAEETPAGEESGNGPFAAEEPASQEEESSFSAAAPVADERSQGEPSNEPASDDAGNMGGSDRGDAAEGAGDEEPGKSPDSSGAILLGPVTVEEQD